MTVVLYPGSFDPVHNGHVEIIEIAAKLFDHVVVAAMRNTQKGEPLFTIYANDQAKRTEARDAVLSAYAFSEESVERLPLFYE